MLKIDLALYNGSKQFAVEWYLKYGRGDIHYSVPNLAVMTMCPCIVTAFWVAEAEKWSQETVEKINKLVEFYGYSSIDNKPDSCPF